MAANAQFFRGLQKLGLRNFGVDLREQDKQREFAKQGRLASEIASDLIPRKKRGEMTGSQVVAETIKRGNKLGIHPEMSRELLMNVAGSIQRLTPKGRDYLDILEKTSKIEKRRAETEEIYAGMRQEEEESVGLGGKRVEWLLDPERASKVLTGFENIASEISDWGVEIDSPKTTSVMEKRKQVFKQLDKFWGEDPDVPESLFTLKIGQKNPTDKVWHKFLNQVIQNFPEEAKNTVSRQKIYQIANDMVMNPDDWDSSEKVTDKINQILNVAPQKEESGQEYTGPSSPFASDIRNKLLG